MSRYKPYPKYKDSGVEWLGEVPEGWNYAPLKYFSIAKTGFAFNSTDFTTDGVPVLRIGDINSLGEIDFTNAKFLPLKFLDANKDAIVRQNDIAMAMTGATIGKSGLYQSNQPALLNQRVCVFRAKSTFLQSYLWYVVNSSFYYEFISLYAFGGAQPNISDSILLSCITTIPSLDEQILIVDFLDRETAKIDALIAKQERMIELLGEKRQALISHAVTKGLDPSVKMKDSGVEWLGEVPEHWGIHKLKYAVERIGDIDHYMPKTVSIGKPYIMTGDMSEKASLIDFSSCKQISEEDFSKLSQKIRPSIGDLIFARYATIGTVCYVDIEDDFLVSYSCVTIKPNHGKTSGKYLFYFFKSNFFLEEIKSYINSNTQGNVGVESLYRTKLAIPPQNEQRFIIDFIEEKTAKIDTLIQKAKQAIELLKERRTALICAAVTGKIDVRDAL